MFSVSVAYEQSHSIFLASGQNAVFLDIPEIFFVCLDKEKIILTLEFSDERDLGNYLVCWMSTHEDVTWPVLVTFLTPEAATK